MGKITVSKFDSLKSASMTGAREIRVTTITEDELYQRAREGFIFAHPSAPCFVRKLARSGRLDWFLASARQALRDIEKPVDLLTHEARAAWVLNMHSPMIAALSDEAKAAVAQVAVTAIRVGTKDAAAAPAAVIQGAGLLYPVAIVLLAVAAVLGFIF